MNILIIRSDFLGDSILTSTSIRMLKQIPNTKIDTLSYEYSFPIFKYNLDITNKYFLYKVPHTHEQQIQNQQIMHKLNQQHYTIALVLNRDLKAYSLLKHVNCNKVFGHKLGVRSYRSKTFCLFTRLFGKYEYIPYDDNVHEVLNQVNLLNFALLKIGSNQSLKLDWQCYFYTEVFNPHNTNPRDLTTVIINISGKIDTVRYIPSTLARCIIEDLLKLDKKVLVIATSYDNLRAKSLLKEINDTRVTLCVEEDLFKLANTMSQYLYYIGADGGLLHIAAGLQMYCLGLFHAQSIKSWHPWTKNQICIQTSTKKIYDLTATEAINSFKTIMKQHV